MQSILHDVCFRQSLIVVFHLMWHLHQIEDTESLQRTLQRTDSKFGVGDRMSGIFYCNI